MGALPAQLAAGLPAGVLRLGRRVESVTPGVVRADGEEIAARAVVVATDPVTATQLLPGVAAPRMYALTTLYFVAPAAPARGPTLHLDATGGPLANTVVLTEAAPGYSPDNRALISSSFLVCLTPPRTGAGWAVAGRTDPHPEDQLGGRRPPSRPHTPKTTHNQDLTSAS
jgi:hypothetical protein